MKKQRNKLEFALAGLVLACGLANPARGQAQPAANPALPNDQSKSIQDYRKYPEESRPLHPGSWDLLHPWSSVGTPMRPMISQQAMSQAELLLKSGRPQEEVLSQLKMLSSPLSYQFELNKAAFAGTRDELQARLTITLAQSSDAALRIHVIKSEMIGDKYFGSPNLGAVPFSCDTAGPACTFTWRAPSADKKYWGILKLQVTLAVEGVADQFAVRQLFYSSPMVAGRFTGEFQERMENGSLVIDAGVNVEKHMVCFVSGNLFSADTETPTHHVMRRMIVDPSMKSISLTFFGQVFRDFGYQGAFRLQDLKAQCENLAYPPEWFMDSVAHKAELEEFDKKPGRAPEPQQILFEYNTYSYTTRRYGNSAFSDAPWQSSSQKNGLEISNK